MRFSDLLAFNYMLEVLMQFCLVLWLELFF